MLRPLSVAGLCLLLSQIAFSDDVPQTSVPPAIPPGMHAVKLNGQTFTLSDGFEIELAGAAPLTLRPIHIDFDELGRLYVAESSGTNDRPQKQLEDKPHSILRLEDTDGDGKFDKRTVFAEKMMFPEGMLWHDGSVYVGAPPSIWKLTDTDGDGVADERVEWFEGKTLNGCANDLHGPYVGRDGWIYWCKGAFEEQRYERPGKAPFVTKASHIFRCRPEGPQTGVEHVMTGGMDNPVEVVFTPGGERIFTTTFLVHPGGGQRDGLIHAVYGGVYGKVHAVIDNHLRTGDILPPMTHLGPAVPAGLAIYESRVFGDEFAGNLFCAQFNMHKISRHVLEPEGATFKTKDSDFLVSDNLDFHPTDVLEDADGSLIVVDTGGWYKLCCPSSQLWKPDVPGAIYRVRKTGAKKVDDPRGLKLAWEKASPQDLAGRLGDERPAVQKRAMHRLGQMGRDAVPAIAQVVGAVKSASARRSGVWTLTRIDDPAARSVVLAALSDQDGTVRAAALHSISLWKDAKATTAVQRILVSGATPLRRLAAETLGRLGDPAAVPALLTVAGVTTDRFLEHAVTYALIEIGNRSGTQTGLASSNPRAKRVALIALDQMGGGLDPKAVAPLLAGADPVLKDTAAWLVGRHPEWGGALAEFLEHRLATGTLSPDEATELARQLGQFAKDPLIQALLAKHVGTTEANGSRTIGLRAMGQTGLRELPAAWGPALATALRAGDPETAGLAVAAVRSIPTVKEGAAELRPALLLVASNEKIASPVRLEALAAVPGGLAGIEANVFDFVRAHLSPETPVTTRLSAGDILSKAKLPTEQLIALTNNVEVAGPLEIERLLGAFLQTTDEVVGLKLAGALLQSPALPNVRPETLQKLFEKHSPAVRQRADEVSKRLAQSTEQQRAKIEALLAKIGTGDIRRGQLVFHGQKTACNTCHAMGYLGGKIGPDLTRIGGIRTERDLLEAVLFPSASFVRSYEPVTVLTKSGKTHSGVLKKDAPDEIILTVNAKEEARIPREEVESLEPATVSIMPAGLDMQLTPQELIDLITFLKAAK